MNIDWSFSDAPGDSDPAPRPDRPAHAPRKPPRRWPWRRLLALAVVAGLAALGAWLFTRLGWLRLQNQLADQLVYEDQRAQAGDVAAVLALQTAGSPAWRAQLAAQVRLGLAAPAPAGDLRPTGAPPRLSGLEALSGDRFAATVTRDYLDPAGQTVSFDLPQTYRNLAPGVWERQPPDLAALAATTPLHLQRLAAQVPTVDLPWLGPALLQADALIVEACADWSPVCTADQRMVVGFGVPQEGTWDQTRWADPAPRAIGLPRIFFAAPSGLTELLPAPLLAGRPHDAAAQAAYSRSLAAQLLGLYASEIASGPDSGRGSNDYFLDALVARAEARHLDALAAPAALAPQTYIPIDPLWLLADAGRVSADWHTDLAWRREAYDFLNWELAGQPVAVDGRLLSALRQSLPGPGVDDWLAAGLGPAALKPASQWAHAALADFAAQPVTDWRPYEGLVLACDDGLRVLTGGIWRTLVFGPTRTGQAGLQLGDVSPNGAYLSVATYTNAVSNTNSSGIGGAPTITGFEIVRLDDGALVATVNSPSYDNLQDVGWSAGNQHIFGYSDARVNANAPVAAVRLMSQAPGGPAQPLMPQPVYPNYDPQSAWSADHSALLVQLNDTVSRGPYTSVFAVLTFTPTVAVRTLPNLGDFVALSPHGDRVAYIHYAGPTNAVPTILDGLDTVQVLNIASGSITSLAVTNDLGLPPGISRFAAPRWSPDGQTVAWSAYGPQGTQAYVLTAPATGGPLRVWPGTQAGQLLPGSFSPDGRYLLADASSQVGPAAFWLFDQQAPGVAAPLAGWAAAKLWLPGAQAHRLVLAGPAGVSSLDPASGAWAWLGGWANCVLRE